MKRKFLAKAITLGLMLAVPLGAQAEEKNIGQSITKDYTYTQDDAVYNADTKTNDVNNIIVNVNSSDKAHTITAAGLTLNITNFFYSADHKLSVEADALKLNNRMAVYKGEVELSLGNDITINTNNENAIRVGSLSNTDRTNGTLNVNARNINLKTVGASGVSVGAGSTLVLKSDRTEIDVSNAKSLKAIEGDASIYSDRITIKADNSEASDTGNSHVIFGNINLAGKNSTEDNFVRANEINITTKNVANAIIASSNTMNIVADTLIINSDTNAFQAIEENSSVNFDVKNADITGNILALKGGTVQFGTEENPTENVTIKGKLFTRKYGGVATDTTIDIHNNGQLTINGDIDTTSREGGTININQGENDNGVLQITGNILTGEKDDDEYTNSSSNINISLKGEQSYIKGDIIDYNQKEDSNVKDGGTNITLSDGATWSSNGDSTVKEVKSNGGVIAITGDKQNVEVKNLTGSDTTIKTDSIDNKLNIGSNNSKLDVVASGKVTDSIGNDIQGGMKKLLENIEVKDGTKETTVKAEAGAVTGETIITRDEDGNTGAAVEKVNKDNAGISEMASIGLMAWRAENNDMNKRLGELRSSKGEHGVWTRMVRGQSKYGAQGIKNQYSTYQLGYDEKLSVDKHWTVGAAVSYTDASSSFTTGHGENKSTGLAIYGSYLGDNGSFVDLIAKAARLKNEFDVMGGAGKGDYETNGYSLSAEYGKRFTKDNGFWIEPQVELTYGYVGAVDYLTSNDVSVRQNGMDSLVGRIGFSLGRDIKGGNVYARASYLYDFDGETDVAFSKNGVTRSFKQDLGGGWWEVGVGTNISLSDATHLYFDVEKTYSGNVATPWQWNAGVRWSF